MDTFTIVGALTSTRSLCAAHLQLKEFLDGKAAKVSRNIKIDTYTAGISSLYKHAKMSMFSLECLRKKE